MLNYILNSPSAVFDKYIFIGVIAVFLLIVVYTLIVTVKELKRNK